MHAPVEYALNMLAFCRLVGSHNAPRSSHDRGVIWDGQAGFPAAVMCP